MNIRSAREVEELSIQPTRLTPSATSPTAPLPNAMPRSTIAERVRTAPLLALNPNGPKICYKLPWNGELEVIELPSDWEYTADHKQLGVKRMDPWGAMHYNLILNDNGMAEDADKPNRHIKGMKGDGYVYASFEPDDDDELNEAVKERCGPDYWLTHWEFETHRGFPIAEDKMAGILSELRFKQLFFFNTYTSIANNTLEELVRGVVSRKNPTYTKVIKKALLAVNKTFRHPEAELAHTSGSFLHPDGEHVVLLKTYEALHTYIEALIDAHNEASHIFHNYSMHSPALRMMDFDDDFIRRMRSDAISEPRMTMNEWGRKHAPDWIAMQREYLMRDEESDAAAINAIVAPSLAVRDAGITAREREEREAKAAAERARRQEIHDAMMAAERAEAEAKAARRKYEAALSRAARAAAPPRPYTARQEPPKSAKKAKLQQRAAKRAGKSKEVYTAATLEHQVHTLPEQSELRADRFDEKQALEHAEKVARLAREKFERLRQREADMSKAQEAATHVVAPAPTLSGVIGQAMKAVGLA